MRIARYASKSARTYSRLSQTNGFGYATFDRLARSDLALAGYPAWCVAASNRSGVFPMLLRLLTAGCLSAVCLSATAQEHHDHAAPAPAQAADISVSQVWSRAMPPSAPTGAVYFLLNNGGKQDDRLIAAHTERAEKTELHTHVHEGDVMRMQQVESVAVPA